MKNKIRKIIREEIAKQLLDEDYESIKQIEMFANDTIKALAKKNIDTVKKIAIQPLEGDYWFFYSVNINEIYQENKGKYTSSAESKKLTFGDFVRRVKHLNVYLTSKSKKKEDVKGEYYPGTQLKRYITRSPKEINLFFDKSFTDNLRKEVIADLKKYEKFEKSDLYFTLFLKFNSTLKHKLQHAFDDFRSNTKIFNTKAQANYTINQREYSKQKEGEKDKELYFKLNKQYLNLPHEIWVRFTQAVGDISFIHTDFENGKAINTMKKLDIVIDDFKISFVGFNMLNEKMKRKLIGRVSQFWHLEQEKLKKENFN